MAKMTDAMSKKYVKDGGKHCPFCGSDNIESDGQAQIDGPEAWQDVTCNKCHESWQDVYKLHSCISVTNNPEGEGE